MSQDALLPKSDALAAQAAPPEERGELFVLFKVDGTEYALPASIVLQMESFTGATPVPGAASFVAGIMQLRGRVLPVVDLRRRFAVPPAELTIDSRVVVGTARDRVVALAVDSAREVARVLPAQRRAPPKVAAEGEQNFIAEVLQLGGRTVLVLDFAKVIGEESIDV